MSTIKITSMPETKKMDSVNPVQSVKFNMFEFDINGFSAIFDFIKRSVIHFKREGFQDEKICILVSAKMFILLERYYIMNHGIYGRMPNFESLYTRHIDHETTEFVSYGASIVKYNPRLSEISVFIPSRVGEPGNEVCTEDFDKYFIIKP